MIALEFVVAMMDLHILLLSRTYLPNNHPDPNPRPQPLPPSHRPPQFFDPWFGVVMMVMMVMLMMMMMNPPLRTFPARVPRLHANYAFIASYTVSNCFKIVSNYFELFEL